MDMSPLTNYQRAHCKALHYNEPSTHLISPQCDVTRRQTNDCSHICLHHRGLSHSQVAHAHVQNTPLEWLCWGCWARSAGCRSSDGHSTYNKSNENPIYKSPSNILWINAYFQNYFCKYHRSSAHLSRRSSGMKYGHQEKKSLFFVHLLMSNMASTRQAFHP